MLDELESEESDKSILTRDSMMQSVRNLLLGEKCAHQLLKMPRKLANREEQGRLIARSSGAVTMINQSNYSVRSITGYNTYIVYATQSGWACSCPDYARYNTKCKHVYAVEFYRHQNKTD